MSGGTIVEGLRIAFPGQDPVVNGVSFEVQPGECLALVGESGAGKSLTAASLLGLVPRPARVEVSRLVVAGEDAARADERAWRRLRGSAVGLVSQDALVSLDPLRRIGREVAESIEVHEPRLGGAAVHERVLEALRATAMPEPAVRSRQYPHELSGGLRQRALIASALASRPGLLVADEPTTALDATVQARVLDVLARLRDDGLAILLISHDIRAVARIADRTAILRDGRILEEAPTATLLSAPRDPYTQELLTVPSRPRVVTTGGEAVLEARALRKTYRRPDRSHLVAVDDISLELRAGAVLGVVGESGSGKTTLARMLLGLERPDAGQVLLRGEPWSTLPERARRARRRDIQLVDQDPFATLDSRFTVRRTLAEAVALDGVPARGRDARIRELLTQVGLDVALLGRRPRELSGGQRQRVAIARALARRPRILVCDEPVSALDQTSRLQVLDLLGTLRATLGVALVFVSHDLAVVEQICDDVLVMRDGRVVESGPVERVLRAPEHPFTRELVAAGLAPR